MSTKQTTGKILTFIGYGFFVLAGLGALLLLGVNGYGMVEDYQHGRSEGWHVIWVVGGAVLLGGIVAGIGFGFFALGKKMSGIKQVDDGGF